MCDGVLQVYIYQCETSEVSLYSPIENTES